MSLNQSSSNSELSEYPPVSVIIPTFNYSSFISRAIDSVLSCGYPVEKLEVVVVDDGSTDNTDEILKSYKDHIQYIQQENQGKAAATAQGIKAASGKYIFTLDADDYFLPGRIQKAVEVFQSDSTVAHIAHPAQYWDVASDSRWTEQVPASIVGQKHDGLELLKRMYRRNITVGGGSTFAARGDVLKALRIPPEVDMFIDEYLWLFTLKQGKSYFFDEPLSVWRIHGCNYSESSQIDLQLEKEERSLRSMEAVREAIRNNEFSKELCAIYELKFRAAWMAGKERQGKKSLMDIFGLGVSLLKNSVSLGTAILPVAYYHNILQRLLPTSLVGFLKKIKRQLFPGR